MEGGWREGVLGDFSARAAAFTTLITLLKTRIIHRIHLAREGGKGGGGAGAEPTTRKSDKARYREARRDSHARL